ncbi:MAG: hypothetical protein RLZZ513_1612, partial [Pseudomonadota bacterium]
MTDSSGHTGSTPLDQLVGHSRMDQSSLSDQANVQESFQEYADPVSAEERVREYADPVSVEENIREHADPVEEDQAAHVPIEKFRSLLDAELSSDTTQHYLNRIGTRPLLTPSQERHYAT